MSNLDRALKIARDKGLDLSSLLELAQQEDIKALRAVRTLMRKCKSPDLREAVLDALPKSSFDKFHGPHAGL